MLQVEIITPEQVLGTLEGDEVSIPTAGGILGVRTGHLPLVAPLKAGEVIVRHDKKKETTSYVVSGGFVEVLPTSVKILADNAERDESLTLLMAEEAVKRAEHIRDGATDRRQLDQATALLEMNLLKLKIARRRGQSR
jgi:F-type H+-transporting ATPase subunit epsilon